MQYSLFIGRWQVPGGLHAGHIKLIEQAKYTPLIGIRDTDIGDNNPYTAEERQKAIEKLGYKTVIIPDIAEVIYGRKVGYNVRQVNLDNKTEEISATKMRKTK